MSISTYTIKCKTQRNVSFTFRLTMNCPHHLHVEMRKNPPNNGSSGKWWFSLGSSASTIKSLKQVPISTKDFGMQHKCMRICLYYLYLFGKPNWAEPKMKLKRSAGLISGTFVTVVFHKRPICWHVETKKMLHTWTIYLCTLIKNFHSGKHISC